jgi:cytoskeleton protein RodZ
VFAKGHLRRYAGLLGLHEEEIVGAYERSKLQVGEPILVPKARLEMAPVRGRPRWPWVVGGTAVFLVAAALLSYISKNGWPWSQEAAEPEPDASPLDPAATAMTAGPQGPVAAGPPDAPSAAAGGPNVGVTAQPGTSATGPMAPPAPGQVSLQLRFAADSWVEIFDGSGKAVLYDLGKSGSERTVTAMAPLSVTLGNAPAVTIAVNGRALPTPSSRDSVARFRVGVDGTLR